jgi:hypothetical protein
MNRPEYYLAKAQELRAKAREEPDPVLRADSERLAASYQKVAQQLSIIQDDAQPTPIRINRVHEAALAASLHS